MCLCVGLWVECRCLMNLEWGVKPPVTGAAGGGELPDLGR